MDKKILAAVMAIVFVAVSGTAYAIKAPMAQEETVMPVSFEDAEMLAGSKLRTTAMWDYSGTHLLVIHYGKNLFYGQIYDTKKISNPQEGNEIWGIYGKGSMSGFYDGGFFWGSYQNPWPGNPYTYFQIEFPGVGPVSGFGLNLFGS